MAKTELYLVRHGQTEWNLQKRLQGHQDSPLTAEGRRQAACLRERLRGVPLDAIYSSSSPRAVHTAEIIAEGRQQTILTLDDLKEIHLGVWEGQRMEQIRNDYAQEYKAFFDQPHLYEPAGRGETFLALFDRAVPSIERLLSMHKGGSILLVTHRFTLKTIMNYYFGNSLGELGSMPDIPSASLSKVVVENNMTSIELLGDTSHYEAKAAVNDSN